MKFTLRLSKYALMIVFLFLFGATTFSLIKPAEIHAACYCVEPEEDGCRCTTSASEAGASFEATATGGEEVRCDTQYEANTYWSVINPVCGTAAETIPYCAWSAIPHCDLICWGTEWVLNDACGDYCDQDFTYQANYTHVQYNGFDSATMDPRNCGVPSTLTVCRSDGYCCNEPANCDGGGMLPYNSCEPQNGGIVNPDWCANHPGMGGDYSCTDRDDPEFHTFRPYPAEPCDRVAHELAPFCGNTLNMTDGFSIEKEWFYTVADGFSSNYNYLDDLGTASCVTDASGQISCAISPVESPCPIVEDGMERCTFLINEREVDFFILMDGTFFPIMGNTEMVVNREENADDLTDAQKVNEYVGWYLTGVTNNPTEYGIPSCLPYGSFCDDPGECCTGHCSYSFFTMNYACSLPSFSEYPIPSNPNSPGVYQEYIDKVVNYSGPLRKLLPHRIQRDIASSEVVDAYNSRYNNASIRHDQIIGCVRNLLNSPLDWGKIVKCYHSGILNKKTVRLTEFTGEPTDPLDEDGLPTENKLPPEEEDYETPVDWVFAFRVWRGQICFLFPDILSFDATIGFCFNNPFALDAYSELFFHIPLSSTEDRVGLVEVIRATFLPLPIVNNPNVGHRITYSEVLDTNPDHDDNPNASGMPYSELYFAHMQETAELADSLQKTYSAKDEPLVTAVSNVQPPLWCDVREVRSNPGDDLFAEELLGTVIYTSEVDCDFTAYDPDDPDPSGALCVLAGASCIDPIETIGETCCTNYGSMDCPGDEICVTHCSNTSNPGSCFEEHGLGYDCQLSCLDCDETVYSDGCSDGFQCALLDDEHSCRADDSVTLPAEQCDTAIYISMETQTKTPKADEVWSRLVAGEKGVFKKLFPKIELRSPIEAIWDIPASSPVTFTSPWLDSVGNPAAERDIPELYFPHIGGIHQYFLKCIQTALRPKGFGEPCLSGSPYGNCEYIPACMPPYYYGTCMNEHPDINLDVRGCEPIDNPSLAYIDYFHPAGSPLLDPDAPQLNTLLEGNARPAITSLCQVNNWDWETNTRSTPIEPPDDLPTDNFATLVGFSTQDGQGIYVPVSGYNIGGGYAVTVLYATSTSMTLKYTTEDDMVYGYGLHLENFSVDQEILDEYIRLNAEGRYELPVLC
ncbi:hypothetical protein KKB40_05260, partial [Patescibacteria group bacterium]|nr:hypothetical protein [Patescibacteria group bacterium]